MANGCASLTFVHQRAIAHQALSFLTCYSDSPLSSRPQPMGVAETPTPCKDTREDFGLSCNFFAPRTVAGSLLGVRLMRAKRSQVIPPRKDLGLSFLPWSTT